ncbi:MAG: cation:proton antiporter [Anaerolineae bacterium]|nr:cation:proton antiporter [Anaerolineae bacterium]
MHHELPLLVNIGVALAAALVGGFIARKAGLPTIVGYLLAGVAIGPFTPGFVGDIESISQLAELGVIFLMFGVGLHFSLRDLWRVRDLAIPGALIQSTLSTVLAFGLTRLWGWPVAAGLVRGLAIPVASTVVLIRGLMDNGHLETRHGQVALGWTVFEDLITVLILVILPALAPSGDQAVWQTAGWAVIKAGAFVGIMLFIGARLVPRLLESVVHTRSRELFILIMLVISLGTALGSAALFQVSLALGAFLAGVVVSESPLSHQVSADVLPFREAFAVLFFVSVGMLVDPAYLWQNAGQVLALTALIVVGKALMASLVGFIFPHPARTALVVGAGLSQIGEFSFIVGQAGLALGLLDRSQYSLILAGALLSITINPFMFRLIQPIEGLLKRKPRLWNRLNHHGDHAVAPTETLSGHVVIVGYGRVGHHIVDVLNVLHVPQLVIEDDPVRVDTLRKQQVPVLFGDAANSEILGYARLKQARTLVVTVPDEPSTGMIVAAAREMAPKLPLVVRASTEEGVLQLGGLGATDVIHPELEGGLEIVRHTLMHLGYPVGQVQRYTDIVRRDQYDFDVNTVEEHRMLLRLIEAAEGIEVTWLTITEASPLVGQSLAEANIRAHTEASVVAIIRDGQLTANPKSVSVFHAGDLVGLIGDEEQVSLAERLYFPA